MRPWVLSLPFALRFLLARETRGFFTTIRALGVSLEAATLRRNGVSAMTFARDKEAAVLLVTHDASIFHRFDRLISMLDGRIEGEETGTRAAPASQGAVREVPTAIPSRQPK